AHRLAGEVVACRVIKQFGADTVAVATGLREAVDDIRRTLPRGVQLRIAYDQSALVQGALGGVGRAVLLGAVLVVVALVTLLGDLRAALVVTATIPLSVGLSGLLLRPAGIGLNAMPLGGLAIAVGLLVDASIIVTENVVHRLRASRDPGSRRRDAVEGAVEVGRPIAFATLIVVAVFLPLFSMTGIEGRRYRPLAAAVVAAVSASLVLALTLVPALGGLVLRPRAPGTPEDVWIVRRLKRAYAPVLDACLRHAGAVRLATLAVTIPALLLASRVGSDFMPRLDEGALLIQTMLPPEPSIEPVDRSEHRVQGIPRSLPD